MNVSVKRMTRRETIVNRRSLLKEFGASGFFLIVRRSQDYLREVLLFQPRHTHHAWVRISPGNTKHGCYPSLRSRSRSETRVPSPTQRGRTYVRSPASRTTGERSTPTSNYPTVLRVDGALVESHNYYKRLTFGIKKNGLISYGASSSHCRMGS